MPPLSSSIRLCIWIITGISSSIFAVFTAFLEKELSNFIRRIFRVQNRGRKPKQSPASVWMVWIASSIIAIVGAAVASSAPDLVIIPPLIESGNSTVRTKLFGLNLSPYFSNQNPYAGSSISEMQYRQTLNYFAPYTKWVRVYSATGSYRQFAPIPHKMGLKLALGAWIEFANSDEQNDAEINAVIEAAQKGYADIVIVGSDYLMRNRTASAQEQLLKYLAQVKQAAPSSVQVTTSEEASILLLHPEIIDAVDVIMVNIYAYYQGISIDQAIDFTEAEYRKVKAAVGDKPVIISGIGWPGCGSSLGNANPSPENSAEFFKSFTKWAEQNEVDYFYDEAMDQLWKKDSGREDEACWGLWDSNGLMKPGISEVFK